MRTSVKNTIFNQIWWCAYDSRTREAYAERLPSSRPAQTTQQDYPPMTLLPKKHNIASTVPATRK